MPSQLLTLPRLIFLGLAALGIYKSVEHITKKRIFISFAIEDRQMRDMLSGQARNEKSPFEFVDMSVKKPWDKAWKTKCRERIKSCDGVIVLMSKNTYDADGVHWEIECAQQEDLKIMAMYTQKSGKNFRIPTSLKGKKIVRWSWKNIQKFVESL